MTCPRIIIEAKLRSGSLVAGTPGVGQELAHPSQEVVGLDVARLEHLGIVGMQADPCPGLLAHTPGQAVVVGVDVGDEHGLDVLDRSARFHQAVVQGRPGVLGVPAGVDDGDPVVELEGIDQDVAQRIVRDRDRDRPQPRPHPLHGGHDVAIPRLFLEDPRDNDHGGNLGGNLSGDQAFAGPRRTRRGASWTPRRVE